MWEPLRFYSPLLNWAKHLRVQLNGTGKSLCLWVCFSFNFLFFSTSKFPRKRMIMRIWLWYQWVRVQIDGWQPHLSSTSAWRSHEGRSTVRLKNTRCAVVTVASLFIYIYSYQCSCWCQACSFKNTTSCSPELWTSNMADKRPFPSPDSMLIAFISLSSNYCCAR